MDVYYPFKERLENKISKSSIESNKSYTRDPLSSIPFEQIVPPFWSLRYTQCIRAFRLLVQLSLFSLSSSLPFSHSFSSPLFHRINRILSLTHSISFIPSLSLSLSLFLFLSRIRMHLYIYIYIVSCKLRRNHRLSHFFFLFLPN